MTDVARRVALVDNVAARLRARRSGEHERRRDDDDRGEDAREHGAQRTG
jgi:hypothetical protein